MAKRRSHELKELAFKEQVKIATMELEYKMGTLEQIQLFLIDILLQLRRLYFILSLYILLIEVLDRNPAD